jgi:hypothetical protein
MKAKLRPTEKNCGRVVNGTAKPTHRTDVPEASAKVAGPERFRRLKKNEVVSRGDFVTNERLGFELWEGPGGFRAGAFLKPIYRSDKMGSRPAATRKSKRNTKRLKPRQKTVVAPAFSASGRRAKS